MTTLAAATADLLTYTTYDDTDFVAEVPRFFQASEERIFFFVQLPYFRAAMVGSMTQGNPYLQLPAGFMAAAGLSIVLASGDTKFLLNKDVEYIREVYPNVSTQGEPFCYAQFDVTSGDTNIIIGPTPDDDYVTQLNYFYKPPSLVDVPTGTWLSENAYDTLLYGALSEASNYLKRVAGIDNMGDTYEQRFLVGMQGLKNLGEARDRKDTYRSGEKRKAETV